MNQISRYSNYALFVIILSFLASSLKAQTSAIAALQTKYDTLIPIFDSFYITYAPNDSAQVRDGRQFSTNNNPFIKE